MVNSTVYSDVWFLDVPADGSLSFTEYFRNLPNDSMTETMGKPKSILSIFFLLVPTSACIRSYDSEDVLGLHGYISNMESK